MLYRVLIDLEKKTADIIIYNAKFAAAAPPLKAILLKGLKVTWGKGSYSIEGENLIPSVPEGGTWQENPRYVFNKFAFNTNGKTMTDANMSYLVAGMYTGQFSGSYVLDPSQKQ